MLFLYDIVINKFLGEYVISILEDRLFTCEPLERDGEYFYIDADNLYIDSEIEKYLDEDFYEYVTCDEILVFGVEEECSDERNCGCCCEDYELMYSEYRLDDENGQKQVAIWEQNECGDIRNIKTWNVAE